MAFRKYAKYRPRRYRKSGKKLIKKAVARARSSNFKKKVLKVIHSQNENKHATTSTTLRIINDAPSTTDMFQIIPNISAGTGDNARVGDEIKPLSLRVRMTLDHLPPINVNSTARTYYGIRVMIVQPRQFRGLIQIAANADTWLSNLLRDGGTKIAFNVANPKSVMLPINSDEIITYYDKVYYESFPNVYQSATAPTSYIYQTEWQKYGHKELALSLKVSKKTFKYDSNVNSGLTPVNYNPVLIVGICNMHGTTDVTSNLSFSYTSQLTYEDA